MKQPVEIVVFRYWMKQAAKQYRRAAKKLSIPAAHDLRVALRKCQTLADAYVEVGEKNFLGSLEKPAKKLFKRLGRLRDMQVLSVHYHKIVPNTRQPKFEKFLEQEKRRLEKKAEKALKKFPIKKWKRQAKRVSKMDITADTAQKMMSLIRAEIKKMLRLHSLAASKKSEKIYHQLRIGFKRLRYWVENFAPRAIENKIPFKKFQDDLGDAHDWSNVRVLIAEHENLLSPSIRKICQKRIRLRRTEKIRAYEALMAQIKPNFKDLA